MKKKKLTKLVESLTKRVYLLEGKTNEYDLKIWGLLNKCKHKVGGHYKIGDDEYIIKAIEPIRARHVIQGQNEFPDVNLCWIEKIDFAYRLTLDNVLKHEIKTVIIFIDN